MLSEERVTQIRERWDKPESHLPALVFTAHCKQDVDYLLSLLDKQSALARELAIIVDVGTCDDPGVALVKVHKLRDDTATAMRNACAAKVRAMGQQWYADAKKRGAAFSDKGRLAEIIAAELESLTLVAFTTKAEGR